MGEGRGGRDHSVLVITSDGGRTLKVTKARNVQVPGIAVGLRGTVIVSGVRADGVPGAGARQSFRAR